MFHAKNGIGETYETQQGYLRGETKEQHCRTIHTKRLDMKLNGHGILRGVWHTLQVCDWKFVYRTIEKTNRTLKAALKGRFLIFHVYKPSLKRQIEQWVQQTAQQNVFWSTFQTICGILAISVFDRTCICELSKCRLSNRVVRSATLREVYFIRLIW